MTRLPGILVLLLPLGALVPAAAESPVDLRSGERVLMLGDTVIEQMQTLGLDELALTLAAGSKPLTFRNLGWSGDRPNGVARSHFGEPQEGFERLARNVEEWKPTLCLISYGAPLAFEEGPDDGFFDDYRRLLAMLREKSAPDMRLVILSPPPLENGPDPLPDQSAANARLAELSAALAAFAKLENAAFIDWFAALQPQPDGPRMTTDTLRRNAAGQLALATALAAGLGLDPPGGWSGRDDLRALIVRKNLLFFHRYRPSNETYLFGFRKHEQGRNAAEMAQYDPIIRELESRIQTVKTATQP